MENKIKKLSDLSLADLMAMHTNYWASRGKWARFEIISEQMFNCIENEIRNRLSAIDLFNN